MKSSYFLFNLFFTEEIFEKIVNSINVYAHLKRHADEDEEKKKCIYNYLKENKNNVLEDIKSLSDGFKTSKLEITEFNLKISEFNLNNNSKS